MNIRNSPTRDQALADGGRVVSGEELRRLIIGNTVWGDYPGGFRFVGFINSNGTSVGTNNVGSDNSGYWSIDCDANTLSVRWDQGWESTTTRAIASEGVLDFFDSDTGIWRMRFSRIVSGRQPLKI